MTDTTIPIFCSDCGHDAEVGMGKLAASMRCQACGSANLGLTGIDPRPKSAARSGPHIDNPEGMEYTPAPDWVTRACNRRFDGGGPAAIDPKKPGHYLHDLSNSWDGHRDGIKDEGNGDLSYLSPYNGQTDRFNEHGYYDYEGKHTPWSRESSLRTAAPKGPGTGWGQPHPDPLNGWSEYAGPTPQTFPRAAPVADSTTCPVCHGSGYDLIDKSSCRECGGTGQITHPTQGSGTQNLDATQRNSPAGGAGLASTSGLTAEAQQRVTSSYYDRAKPTIFHHADGSEMYDKGYEHGHQGKKPKYTGHGDYLMGHRDGQSDRQVEDVMGYPTSKNMASLHTAGRPNTADPYDPEYQNMHGSPEYRSRVSPSIEFDPHNKDSFYPSSPHRSPATDVRQDRNYSAPAGPYQMDQASCPNCGHAPTELRKDKNEDAWWHCPGCGPLANVDAHPDVNPYSPPQGFTPDRNMKTGGFLSRNRKTGRLLPILAKIHETNDLDCREAVELARKTVAVYREAR